MCDRASRVALILMRGRFLGLSSRMGEPDGSALSVSRPRRAGWCAPGVELCVQAVRCPAVQNLEQSRLRLVREYVAGGDVEPPADQLHFSGVHPFADDRER